MSSKEDTLAMLRACLVSSKGGVSLLNLKREYRNLTGEFIPYQKFGFMNLEDFLTSLPDVLLCRDRGGEYVVQARPSESTEHLQRMVDKQKAKPKKVASRGRYSSSTLYRPNNNTSRYKYVRTVAQQSNAYSVPRNATCGSNNPRNVTNSSSNPRNATNGPRNVTNGPSNPRNATNGPSNPRNATNGPSNVTNGPSNPRNATNGPSNVTNGPSNPRNATNVPNNVTSGPSNPRNVTNGPSNPRNATNVPNNVTNGPSNVTNGPSNPKNTTCTINPRNVTNGPSNPRNATNGPSNPKNATSGASEPSNSTSGQSVDPKSCKKKIQEFYVARPLRLSTTATPLKVELRDVGDNTWTRSVKPQSPLPPLPPSPPSPLVAPLTQPFELQMDRAVYPPEPAPSCGVEQVNFRRQLVQFAHKHSLQEPEFKSAPIHDLKQVKYIGAVKVGAEQVSASSCREETRERAEEAAAELMLQKLRNLSLEPELPVTHPEQLVVRRLFELMSQHPHGLWASEVSAEYVKQHAERLPCNWLALVEHSDQYEVVSWSDRKVLVQLAEEVVLPALVPPADMYWDVYITHVVSTAEVWLRLLGEEYSERLAELTEEIGQARSKLKFGLRQVHAGSLVLARQQDEVHRARVLRWLEGSATAQCQLLDAGDCEDIALENMARLPQKFARLPAQALKCRLHGLASLRDDATCRQLARKLFDQTRIAQVRGLDEDGCPLVTIFDTSSAEDVNENAVLLQELLNAPLFSRDMAEVAVSHVTDTCQVFVQPRVELLRWLEEQLEAERAEAAEAAHLAYLNTTAMYLARHEGRLARVQVKNRAGRLVCARPITEVFFVDYGWRRTIATSQLYRLATSHLTQTPPLAVLCSLRGVPPSPGLVVKPSAAQRLRELLPADMHAAVRLSQLDSSPPMVELLTRSPSNVVCSVNDTLALDPTLFQPAGEI